MKIRPDVDLANLSDTGNVRSENEDYYCYLEPAADEEFNRKGRLIAIADGMGGHNAGEVAAWSTMLQRGRLCPCTSR